ncbi:PilN domain-containing protein [Kineococcus gynurae]|uniref:PilN domain-containing protein n=1 Tax=Kineococcus gynurae TaxID=452979 RepID=A0ABV5LUP8_9ACTN
MSLLTLDSVRTRSGVVRVNLLPTEFAVARQERRLRLQLATAVGVVAAACLGAGFLATSQAHGAENSLLDEQTRTSALQAQQAPYAEVPQVLAEVAEAKKIQSDVSGYAVPWYAYLNRISTATPAGVTFTSLGLSVQPTPAATAATGSAATADPLAVQGIGNLTVTGTTQTQAQVASWMDAMAGIPGIAGATLTSSTFDPASSTLTFNATATLTDAVLLDKQ